MSDEPEISRPLRPLATISRPTFAVPAGWTAKQDEGLMPEKKNIKGKLKLAVPARLIK